MKTSNSFGFSEELHPSFFVEPTITVNWRRFKNDPTANLAKALTKPYVYATYGTRGSGKSSLTENIAYRYPKVLDLFGSRDNEGLAWCRSPKKRILFLKGGSVEIDSQWKAVNCVDFTLSDAKDYDAIISASCFYGSIQEEWYGIGKLMDKLWYRGAYKEVWCLVIREAGSLLYSRQSLGDTQEKAKNYMTYVLREMRHCGFALTLDSIRWRAIDINIRTLADYTFLKAQGIAGLPSDLNWLYQYYDPHSINRMAVNKFIVVNDKGPIGDGEFSCPYWHKKEHEDLTKLLDIRITRNELPDTGETGVTRVGDYEHVRIVKARHETGLSMEKLGEKLGRSSKTIHKHITYHNSTIDTLGECDRCARVKSLLVKSRLE